MLDTFFRPQSVAVIGASREPEKLGYAVLANIQEGGYEGRLYPVNPKADEILGLKAYPSVLDIPDPVDLAVIVIPYRFVPAVLEECGQKGIPSVVIISAGFREAGREGLERERELIEIAAQVRHAPDRPQLPGCDRYDHPAQRDLRRRDAARPGHIAFMSQSGALGTAVLDMAMAGHIGFSKFVSLGNKADVSEIDLLEAWGSDPDSRVILIYVEGVPDGQKFIEMARQVTREKPVVAIKSGVTESGSRAVSSHTGSLAGSEAAYKAAFKQAGIIRATSMEALFDYARAFAYQPLLQGDRIGIVTNAGGPGILATDALEHAGLQIPRLSSETIEKLTGLPARRCQRRQPGGRAGRRAGRPLRVCHTPGARRPGRGRRYRDRHAAGDDRDRGDGARCWPDGAAVGQAGAGLLYGRSRASMPGSRCCGSTACPIIPSPSARRRRWPR